jgi:transposase
VSSGKGRAVQRCSPQDSADVRGNGEYVAFIDGQPGRRDRRGGHSWTATDLLGDASRDTSRAIARGRVSGDGRVGALPGAGAGGVVAPGARGGGCRAVRCDPRFFACFDKVQVKYEMLRAQVVDGQTASAAASAHGYSRAAFYLVAAAFERSGMVGLLDERPGRRGPLRLSPEVLAFLEARRREQPEASGAQLARELEAGLGVRLHRRTVEKAVGARG